MNSNNMKEEKRLLNIALKYREEISEEDFNAIVSLCYGRIMEKKLNNCIDRMIMPTYNRIIKSMISSYAKK